MALSWVDKLARAIGATPRAQGLVWSSDSRVMSSIFAPDSPVLPSLTEQGARAVAAVTACVNLVAGAISSMPMRVLRRDANWIYQPVNGDDLWWLLNEQFAPRWSASAAWEYLIASRMFYGDAFCEIVRAPGGAVLGLAPIHPARVRVALAAGPKPGLERLVYAVTPEPDMPGTGERVIDQDDMLHVPGDGFDGLRSLSPLQSSLRASAGVAKYTQEYASQFFKNSARPDFVLTSPSGVNWSKEKIDRIRSEINERHSGAGGWHKPMLLTEGTDIKMLSMPMEDLQLLQMRAFQIEEIARVYGVPPFMIGHNEKTTSWGSGVEAMGISFVRYTLGRHLTAIHNEFNRKLIRRAPKLLEFDTFELERADMGSMFTAFRAAVGRAGEPGFLSVNEVREYLKRGPAPADIDEGKANAQPTF